MSITVHIKQLWLRLHTKGQITKNDQNDLTSTHTISSLPIDPKNHFKNKALIPNVISILDITDLTK